MTLPRAIVFDLDGTLFDHVGAATAGVRSWLGGLGVDVTPDVLDLWFTAENRHHTAWRTGEISFLEQRRRRVREVFADLGLDTDDDAWCDETFAGFLAGYRSAWTAFPDTAGALAQVKALGLATAVLTNGAEDQQNAKVDAIGVRRLVGPVFTAEGLGTPKPDPRSYLTVCSALGVPPAEVVHVGDDHELDVLAPRATGLRAVHCDRLGTGPVDPHTVSSLAELVPLLRGTS